MFKQWVYDKEVGWRIGMFTYLIPWEFTSTPTRIEDLRYYVVD